MPIIIKMVFIVRIVSRQI